jgi:hypothetical protein
MGGIDLVDNFSVATPNENFITCIMEDLRQG